MIMIGIIAIFVHGKIDGGRPLYYCCFRLLLIFLSLAVDCSAGGSHIEFNISSIVL